MAERQLPSIDLLRQLLRYEPETGKLFWKERSVEMFKTDDARGAEWCAKRWNKKHAGRAALTAPTTKGYLHGHIFRIKVRAHRVIWAIVHGDWPVEEIDHINCDPSDNRIANLRLASRAENQRNKFAYRNNTSGLKGVSWHSGRSKWAAYIRVKGKTIYLGLFAAKHDAHLAYQNASEKYHGEFSRKS